MTNIENLAELRVAIGVGADEDFVLALPPFVDASKTPLSLDGIAFEATILLGSTTVAIIPGVVSGDILTFSVLAASKANWPVGVLTLQILATATLDDGTVRTRDLLDIRSTVTVGSPSPLVLSTVRGNVSGLGAVSASTAANTAAITGLDGRADALEAGAATTASGITALQGRAAALEATTGTHTTAITGLASSVAALQAGAIDLAREFGIVHDGTDQTAKFNAAFAAHPGRVLRLSRVGTGVCLVSSALTFPSGTELQMDDDVVLNSLALTVTGSAGAGVNLTSAAHKGDLTVTLADVTGIASDTWLFLHGCVNLSNTDGGADQLLYDPDYAVYAGEYVRVASVAGNVVTIWSPLRWGYTLAPGPTTTTRGCSTAQIVAFATAAIRGGTIIPVVSGGSGAAIRGTIVKDMVVEGVTFDHRSGGASPGEGIESVVLQDAMDCEIRRCKVLREPYGGTVSSGISLRNSFLTYNGEACSILDCEIDGGAQGVDISYTGGGWASWGHAVEGCVVRNSYDALTSHPGGKQHRFSNNTCIGCGIKIRSPETVSIGNQIVGANMWGVYFMGGFLGGCRSIGDTVEGAGTGSGIYVNWTAAGPVPSADVLIDGATITGAFVSVYVNSAQQDALHRAVRLSHCDSRNPISAHVVVESYANGFEAVDCRFEGAPSAPSAPGVINLAANTADVTIGRNTHVNVGTLPAIAGPGSTILADAATWPAGDAAANWSVAVQTLCGANGGQWTGMPAALGTEAIVVKASAGQVANLLSLESPAGAVLSGFSASGQLVGSVVGSFIADLAAAGIPDATAAAWNRWLDPSIAIPIYSSLHGATDGLNFVASMYRRNSATRTTLPGLLGWSFTRASAATADDASFVQSSFASGSPRRIATRGLGVFQASANKNPNAEGAGAILGQTNAGMPTTWQPDPAASTNWSITAQPSISGHAVTEITVSGTPGSASPFALLFGDQSTIAASVGETWAADVDLGIVAGSVTLDGSAVAVGSVLSGINHGYVERGGASAWTTTSATSLGESSSPTRVSMHGTLATSGTTHLQHTVQWGTAAGAVGHAVSFTLMVSRPNLQKAALALPYVPTTSGAATCAADFAALTGVVYGATWTLYVNAETNPVSVANQTLLSWDDGTASNAVTVYRDGSSVVLLSIDQGGVSLLSQALGTFAGDQTVGVAVSYSAGTVTVSVNQGSPTTYSVTASAMTTLMSALARWVIGADAAGANQLNGFARSVLGFNGSALTGSALQALAA